MTPRVTAPLTGVSTDETQNSRETDLPCRQIVIASDYDGTVSLSFLPGNETSSGLEYHRDAVYAGQYHLQREKETF